LLQVWHQTGGKVDAFICAAGTGGTIGGTSVFLKEQSNGAVKCFLMDPSSCGIKYHVNDQGEICLAEKTPEEKKQDKSSVMEGIGSAKLYFPLSKARLNGVLTSHDDRAFEMANWLLRHEGCRSPALFSSWELPLDIYFCFCQC
jgi:cysteine synthase A